MNILIVDDEKDQRVLLREFLKKNGYYAIDCDEPKGSIQVFKENPINLVILDYKMPEMTGDELLEKLKAINPNVKFIMITAYGAVDVAVKVMKMGASDFIEKPIDLKELIEKIRNIENELQIEEDIREIKDTINDYNLPINMIVKNQKMKDIISTVKRVANSPWSVLIKGETGTGKELIASLVHLLSPRRDKPFIQVNCASIPENLFESELFGHEKGAFTGAISRRRGKFELASDGTIFLDEVGELPISLQPKLLRVIQEKKITRVGGETDIYTDVRVVSATNRDLKKMCEKNLFREDLYFRLNVFEIEIPPLRERKDEIPDLVNFFVKKYSGDEIKFSPEAMDVMLKYPFPGNIRELEHIIQRVTTLARSKIIKANDLPLELKNYEINLKGGLTEKIEAFEKEAILNALVENDWVQTRAANSLGISERVLRYKMDKYGIKNLKYQS